MHDAASSSSLLLLVVVVVLLLFAMEDDSEDVDAVIVAVDMEQEDAGWMFLVSFWL